MAAPHPSTGVAADTSAPCPMCGVVFFEGLVRGVPSPLQGRPGFTDPRLMSANLPSRATAAASRRTSCGEAARRILQEPEQESEPEPEPSRPGRSSEAIPARPAGAPRPRSRHRARARPSIARPTLPELSQIGPPDLDRCPRALPPHRRPTKGGSARKSQRLCRRECVVSWPIPFFLPTPWGRPHGTNDATPRWEGGQQEIESIPWLTHRKAIAQRPGFGVSCRAR